MPTDNRRVATYLPKELDDRFKEFTAERNLKGDSPALIAILSEYFGVSHAVSHKVDYSGFATVQQVDELSRRISEVAEEVKTSSLASELLSRLPDDIQRLEDRIAALESANRGSTWTPPIGQLNLLPKEGDTPSEPTSDLPEAEEDKPIDELPSELESELLSEEVSSSTGDIPSELHPMRSPALSRRFKLNEKAVINAKTTIWKNSPDKFLEWTKKRDPDGIPWQYNPDDKLYHPILTEEEF